jgi:integrase
MRYPFTLYRKKSNNGTTIWHARFWDESQQKYAISRTTGILAEGKKEHRREAEDMAKKLYDEFTEIKSAETKPTVTQSEVPAAQIPQGNPASQQTSIVANTPLIEYLSNFWTPNSEYAQFKRNVDKNPLTPYYIEMNHDDVRRHVVPFPGFTDLTVGNLTKAILKKWLIWLAGRKTIRRKKDGSIIEGNTLSGRRANTVLQSVRVAIRWAVDNDEIDTDPFRKLGEVSENTKEKGVLTFEERNKLATSPIRDYRSRLVMLLGSYCGLRRGEMRGLQWGDIKDGIITVQHNFIDSEGVKQPKYNSTRKVPITTDVQKILDIARQNAFNTSPENYVLESPLRPGTPLCNNFFRESVTKELESIGITSAQQKERVLTCHSLRHTFITLAQLSGVPDVVIRALAGHKSEQVQRKYSHVPQVIDFNDARKKLEAYGANEPKAANG